MTLHRKQPATRLTCTASALLLAISTLPLAAQGGKKPGGGGSGVTINPTVILGAAPIEYQLRELRWHGLSAEGVPEEILPDFGGVTFFGINNQGLVVGFIGRPLGYEESYRVGFINLDPASGNATNAAFDLNQVFGTTLAALNTSRQDGPWRIAYSRGITGSGLIACHLIPVDEPRRYQTPELPPGKEPVPCLFGVLDLSRRDQPDGLVLLEPENTGPDQNFGQMTESGHILTTNLDPATGSRFSRLFRREGSGYSEIPLPIAVALGTIKGLNDALQIFTHQQVVSGTTTSWRLLRYEANPNSPAYGTETVFWQSSSPSLSAADIAEDGTCYANARYQRSGRNAGYYSTPFHLLSPTVRTPLTFADEDGTIVWEHHGVSHAWLGAQALSGEEEVFLRVVKGGQLSYQIYRPNLGRRFQAPLWLPPGSGHYFLIISPPHAGTTNPPLHYRCGYIGYSSSIEPRRAFVLVPDGASDLQPVTP
jgi:hypothetical protein